MWTTLVLIVGAIFIYILWYKVKFLEKKIEAGNEITRLHIDPKDEFWELPLIREAMGLKHGELERVDKEKFFKWRREHWKIFSQNFTFFWDKELIFSSNDYGAGFANFPYRTTNLYFKVLKDWIGAEDDVTIEFNIAIRYLDNILPKQKIPVYTGYLKKHKELELDRKKDEILILFNFPHAFINPVFCNTKNNQPIIAELEKRLELEPKNDNDNWGDFSNDFGEQDWFSLGSWHENKYFKFRY